MHVPPVPIVFFPNDFSCPLLSLENYMACHVIFADRPAAEALRSCDFPSHPLQSFVRPSNAIRSLALRLSSRNLGGR
jgi:hypothetical protein